MLNKLSIRFFSFHFSSYNLLDQAFPYEFTTHAFSLVLYRPGYERRRVNEWSINSNEHDGLLRFKFFKTFKNNFCKAECSEFNCTNLFFLNSLGSSTSCRCQRLNGYPCFFFVPWSTLKKSLQLIWKHPMNLLSSELVFFFYNSVGVSKLHEILMSFVSEQITSKNRY